MREANGTPEEDNSFGDNPFGGEVLGHVIGELWWFEGGVGVELWSDLAGETPVGPGTNRQGSNTR